MTTPRNADRKHRFQAQLGDRTIELELGRGEVTLDGRVMSYDCRWISERRLSILLDGKSYSAVVVEQGDGRWGVHLSGREIGVRVKTERDLLLERFGLAHADESGTFEVRAPMPGLVLSVAVRAGQNVSVGDGLLVLEAMKMENELRSDRDGVVKAVHAAPGDAVGKNDILVEIARTGTKRDP